MIQTVYLPLVADPKADSMQVAFDAVAVVMKLEIPVVLRVEGGSIDLVPGGMLDPVGVAHQILRLRDAVRSREGGKP